MKKLLKIPPMVWFSIITFASISIFFIKFILFYKVEQTLDVELKSLGGNKYELDNQIIPKLHKYGHLTIQSDGKFYTVFITSIENGKIELKGFKPSVVPGVIYKAKFILGYSRIYSLLFGSV